jgi:hypothetical protein
MPIYVVADREQTCTHCQGTIEPACSEETLPEDARLCRAGFVWTKPEDQKVMDQCTDCQFHPDNCAETKQKPCEYWAA